MGVFTINQAMRSMKLALMLVLNGYDPETEYVHIKDLPRNTNGRPTFTFAGQVLDCTHGPYGTALWPGLVIEYGKSQFHYGKYKVPIIVSISRMVQNSPEFEQTKLDQMVSEQGISNFIYNVQHTPVYQFSDNDDDVNGTCGNICWFFNGNPYVPVPQEQTIGEAMAGGWLRKEWHMEVSFFINQNTT